VCDGVRELYMEEEEEEGNSQAITQQGHPPKGTERSRVILVAHPTALHKDTAARLEKAQLFPYTAQKVHPLSFYKQ